MTDNFKRSPTRDKVATVPIPGKVWDAMAPNTQMAYVAMEIIKFMASPFYQDFGGFNIIATYPTKDPGRVEAMDILSIGRDGADNSGLIVPEKPKIILN